MGMLLDECQKQSALPCERQISFLRSVCTSDLLADCFFFLFAFADLAVQPAQVLVAAPN